KLFDEALIINEDSRALFNCAGDEIPHNQTDGDMWKEICQRQLEEHGVQQTQCQSHHASSDGDPKRSQNRTAVALLDVLQTQHEPQFVLFSALEKVFESGAESLGIGRRYGMTLWSASHARNICGKCIFFLLHAEYPSVIKLTRWFSPAYKPV